MLRWRLILGFLLVAALAALCWLDAHAARPGVYLAPLAVVLTGLAAQEMLGLFQAGGHRPAAWTVFIGTLLPVLASAAPIAWKTYPANCPVGRLGWLACGLAAGLLVCLVGEMQRFRINGPGGSTVNLALGALSVLYVGGLMGFLVQLRLLPIVASDNFSSREANLAGMFALLSMILVVKMTDTGAYTAGRLWGRHKMAPTLSPGKTWEGAAGGLVAALVGALIAFGPLASTLGYPREKDWSTWVGEGLAFGCLVGVAGMIGDLAESLLKRDAGVKDSSTWLPGFGGVLDLLDSLLVAGPVAYACWLTGLASLP